MILMAILIGILSICLGSLIGFFIATKTTWLNKFNSKNKKMDKILNDPELLKGKIEESYKRVNPDAKGEFKMVDSGEEIKLEIKEKDGMKILDFKRTPYIPPKGSEKILEKVDFKK
jgi:uncharacterized protein YneF (UPF0154 family)